MSSSSVLCSVERSPLLRGGKPQCYGNNLHMHHRVQSGAQDFKLPADEKAPLLVKIHGGPTSATGSSFSLKIQYWTSRGAQQMRSVGLSKCMRDLRLQQVFL